jgi:hypothetical protein
MTMKPQEISKSLAAFSDAVVDITSDISSVEARIAAATSGITQLATIAAISKATEKLGEPPSGDSVIRVSAIVAERVDATVAGIKTALLRAGAPNPPAVLARELERHSISLADQISDRIADTLGAIRSKRLRDKSDARLQITRK